MRVEHQRKWGFHRSTRQCWRQQCRNVHSKNAGHAIQRYFQTPCARTLARKVHSGGSTCLPPQIAADIPDPRIIGVARQPKARLDGKRLNVLRHQFSNQILGRSRTEFLVLFHAATRSVVAAISRLSLAVVLATAARWRSSCTDRACFAEL